MPCAGKTGTTNDHKDGWFVGFTRYYTTSVWVGCDYPKEIKDLSGSSYPGKIWYQFMSRIHKGLKAVEFLPYAQLSEEFIDQREQEKEEQEQRREEGQEPKDDGASDNDDDANRRPPDDNSSDQPSNRPDISDRPSDSPDTSDQPSDSLDEPDDEPDEPAEDADNTPEENGPGDSGPGKTRKVRRARRITAETVQTITAETVRTVTAKTAWTIMWMTELTMKRRAVRTEGKKIRKYMPEGQNAYWSLCGHVLQSLIVINSC